ncbi:MAG: hypothetical protein ACXVLQ_16050 [Bacteriovorax sp.]
MKNGILISALTMTFSFSQAFACDINGKTGFMPENNLRISKYDKETNGMTKARFEAIVNRVYTAYSPIVAAKGATLEMDNNWDDETVNAYANRTGSTWHVNMFGGLARHPLVTDDGFLLVVCHETGHHLGGAPKIRGFGNNWASNEGQADYFGSLKCMKRVLANDDNQAIVANMTIDSEAKSKCEMVYKSGDEIALCERIAMAGKSLAQLLGSLGGNPNVAFNTPDPSVVKKTFDSHPQAQCRMDTYFSGSLCDKAFTEDVSDRNPINGTCIKKDGYVVGPRPLCWYKPSAREI